MPFQLTKPVTIGIGVSVCGVTGYLIYHMYQKWKNGAISRIDAIIKEKTNFGSIEKPIPKSCLKALLKNHGRARVMLEEISSTRITIYVINSAQEKYACIITGHTPQIEHAALLINEMVEKEDTVFTETIWVPQFAVGKIIGRGGANVQNIMAMSNARVQILDEMRSNSLRRVLVQGTFMQVNIAIRQIKKVIERVLEMNKALAEREARAQIGASGNVCPADESSSNQRSEELATTSGHSDSPFEVYISAMVDPSRFWVQIVGPKAKELDLLVEEMTEYYENADNQELHQLGDVAVGDLVAATFKYDNKWYRAEILSLQENNQHAELYYADYGDTDIVSVNALFELRTDFLRLHFQAIECYLARVGNEYWVNKAICHYKSLLSEPLGGEWSEEAVDKFEEWTYVAQWHKLSAKVNEYCMREKTRAKCEGSPVPGVELFDVANEYDIDIGQELVRHGYAVYKKEASCPNSRATSVTTLSNVSQLNTGLS